MLRIDLRALREGPIDTRADVPVDDPLLADLEFTVAAPVGVRGTLTESGPDVCYWHAEIRTTVEAGCRRCLAPVPVEVGAEVRVLLMTGETGDDPSTYPIPADADEVQLGDVVREELILAVPDFVVCRDDCRGLCPQCGMDLNNGPCDCRPEPDPRWAALEGLRSRLTDKER